ncbi:hypothetical protein [Lentzea flaviverrucosa]|uniref:hypothetical protein n=1 Tax=Lentzea flaviverrucosa TaxID=200379 RepID=UPI0011603131|nr:hypothetical protein [Lentzea flaviverrucosa]
MGVPEDGWGPPRQLFSGEARPTAAVFNSVTDNTLGDERFFLRLRGVGAKKWVSAGSLPVEVGSRYEGTIRFRNDNADRAAGLSRQTRVSMMLPAVVDGRAHATATVSSGSADPPEVWRWLVLASSGSAVLIRVVPNSASLHTTRIPAGVSLPVGELFSESGALVGCDGPTGDVTGEDDCRGEVRFQFAVDQPDFAVSQLAAARGTTQYTNARRMTTDGELDVKVKYKNTGTIQQDDVVIKYALPTELTYIPGTTTVANSATDGKWQKIDDNAVVERGINLGSYAPDGVSYVRLSVRVSGQAQLRCGVNRAVGVATAETRNSSKSQKSTIEIERTC